MGLVVALRHQCATDKPHSSDASLMEHSSTFLNAGAYPNWAYLRHSSNLCITPTTNNNSAPAEDDPTLFAGCMADDSQSWHWTSEGALKNKAFGVCLRPKNIGGGIYVLAMSYTCTHPSNVFNYTVNGALQHVATGKCLVPAAATPAPGTNLVLDDTCNSTQAAFVESDLEYCDALDNGSPNPCAANATCSINPGNFSTSITATCACGAGKCYSRHHFLRVL
jgi:hypothetical protein